VLINSDCDEPDVTRVGMRMETEERTLSLQVSPQHIFSLFIRLFMSCRTAAKYMGSMMIGASKVELVENFEHSSYIAYMHH